MVVGVKSLWSLPNKELSCFPGYPGPFGDIANKWGIFDTCFVINQLFKSRFGRPK